MLASRVCSPFLQNESAQLDENSILVGLPRSLKLQMDITTQQSIFLHMPLFRMCSDEEILLIVQCLKPGLALPGEALVRQGERGSGLFFIMKGVVEILAREERVRLMSAIAAVGETSLLDDATPNATVRAYAPSHAPSHAHQRTRTQAHAHTRTRARSHAPPRVSGC